MATPKPQPNRIYTIELCSGETRQWKYLGLGEGCSVWWFDTETKSTFNESSILYAWKILGESSDPTNT